jgi:hypothetical protein
VAYPVAYLLCTGDSFIEAEVSETGSSHLSSSGITNWFSCAYSLHKFSWCGI